MSRKRRRRPQTQRVDTKPVVQDQAAQDGYINTLAYLGEASPLSQANDYERHSISNDFNLLTILYRENWLAARIIDTPCEDMTRSWYSISSEIDQEKLDELAKLEAKHSVKQEITNAIRWGRLYGGAAAVMVIKGQEDMLDEPLDFDMLQPGCFRGLIVIDRVRGIFPSIELEEDMDDPEFGYPKWYQVTLNEEDGSIIRIHHSRLLLFRGRQLPIDEEINADYWGASELEHVYEELQKRNSSSANIAQLIFQANVAALKISDYGEVLGMGTAAQRKQVYNYLSEMNRLRTSFGITLMGNEDNYEQHPYSFAGVAEVYETFMMDMAGASEIPATKLFGRAPQGMNATGESDMKNYYEVIAQLQERILRPALEKLLPVMCMSLWGEVPEDMEVVFEPLGTTTPSERAEIMGQAANPIIQAFSAGLISQQLALKELRESGKPINAWTNISDEDIEKADTEVDQGEGMEDPMGMMGPGGPQAVLEGAGGAQMEPEQGAGNTQAQLEGQGQAQAELDMDKVHELRERIHRMRNPEEDERTEKIRELRERIEKIRERNEETLEEPEKPQEDAEEKKAGLIERAKAILAKRDERRIKRVKEQIIKAVAEQDIDKAKKIIEAYRRYRERKQKPGVFKDALTFLKGMADGGPGSGNFGHAGRPGKKGGSAPSGSGTSASSGTMREPAKTFFGPEALLSWENPRYTGEYEMKKDPRTGYWVEPTKEEKRRQEYEYEVERGNKIDDTSDGDVRFAMGLIKQDSNNPRNSEKKRKICGEIGKDLEWVMESKDRNEFVERGDAVDEKWSKEKENNMEDFPLFAYGNFERVLERERTCAKEFERLKKEFEPVDYTKTSSMGGTEGRLREPVDNSTPTDYNGKATKGWKGLKASMKVGGPKGAKKYISEYFTAHPEVAKEASKYMDVRRKVRDFLKDHPDAENFNTYDAETGEVKNIQSGYCVTFHQNNSETDTLGGYSDEDYANLCAIAINELGAKGVNIGYYGNPEVSFECESEEAAKRFAVEHNQQSVYNASTGRTLVNKAWRQDLNPIKL